MDIQPLALSTGSHKAGSGKGCAMNVISWENGDTEITDFPDCSDPMLAAVVQYVNDTICKPHTPVVDLAGSGRPLCPEHAFKVLTLAHRTVGTNLGTDTSAQNNRLAVAARVARSTPDLIQVRLRWMFGSSESARHVGRYLADFRPDLADAHRLIDIFESVTGIKGDPAPEPQVVNEAISKMLVTA